MPESPRTAVLLMAYGTPPSLAEADVRAYLAHILQFYHRTAPMNEEVQRLRARYRAIGGSPLYDVTARIVTATQRSLDLAFPGVFRVFMAMKHSPPFIEERVARIAEEGFERAVAIPLSPFRSQLATGAYHRVIKEANARLAEPIHWCYAGDWHLHPIFLALWQRRLEDALLGSPEPPAVVFTNHSLSAQELDPADPYSSDFEATAGALAKRCGLTVWYTAYQSAGGGKTLWLGPALGHVLAELIGTGHPSILVVPVGFVMDHLEVLYDLDVDAAQMGRELGATVTRTLMPNDDPLLIALLTDIVRTACGGARVKRGAKTAT